MHALLSQVLTAAIFLHTVLGCCWHQGRDCEHSVAKLSESGSGCELAHRHQSQQSGPCKCRLHCQDTCKAVRPERTEITKADSAAPFDVAAALLASTAASATPAEFRQTVLERAVPTGLLRPHLLHQILLI